MPGNRGKKFLYLKRQKHSNESSNLLGKEKGENFVYLGQQHTSWKKLWFAVLVLAQI